MKRDEAIAILKELLDNCTGLDRHSLELVPPDIPKGGYQILIKPALNPETRNCIQTIVMKHQLSIQVGSMWKTKRSIKQTEPDTFIIYKLNKERKA